MKSGILDELAQEDFLSEMTKSWISSQKLYGDDGLGIFRESPRQVENIKKNICRIFKDNNLQIVAEANKKLVHFVDVTLDLNACSHRPFINPNNNPCYVHTKSNHPPSIIKNIPLAVNKRLSEISSNEEEFNRSKDTYQKALADSGYSHQLKYEAPCDDRRPKRQRPRNITWFNPPYDMRVRSNIGRKFLTLIDKCFPTTHVLRQVCNRNTLKLSYSTMPNIQRLISSDNVRKLQSSEAENAEATDDRTCNCRRRDQCPMNGSCLRSGVIYQAVVSTNNGSECYVGLTENTFKTRYNQHQHTFRHSDKRFSTELSKYIWTLKDNNEHFDIEWHILDHAKVYSNIAKRCSLCISEKYYIICKPNLASLNKRTELLSECRHSRKFCIGNVT